MALTETIKFQKEIGAGKRAKARPTITERGRLSEIRTCVQICLDAMNADSAADVAARTGLSISTAYRLIAGGASLDTHIGTVQALGYAAGLRIEMTETKILMSLAK